MGGGERHARRDTGGWETKKTRMTGNAGQGWWLGGMTAYLMCLARCSLLLKTILHSP